MEMETKQIKVETIKGGAIIEGINEAIQKVLDNIVDPNSEPDAKREVVLKLAFKPSTNRAITEISAQIKPNLAPDISIRSAAYVVKENGKGFASEVKNRQQVIPGTEGPAGSVHPFHRNGTDGQETADN